MATDQAETGQPAPPSRLPDLRDWHRARLGALVDRVMVAAGHPALQTPVQAKMRSDGPGTDEPSATLPEEVHAAAAAGVAGAAQPLPHREKIEASFERDLGGARAFIGGPAAPASAAIGATAYARGEAVAFGQAPDLRTAAHEAAHLVQQQSGVSLDGGVGRAGDRYERQADAAADAVVAGRSARHLLPPAGAAGPPAVQRQAAPAAEKPKEKEIDFEKEFNSLPFSGDIADRLKGYKNMRGAILAQFGSLEQATAYYKGVKHHSFIGQRPRVYEAVMGPKLDAAEKALKAMPSGDGKTNALDEIKQGAPPTVGGFVIRPNVNKPTELSNHSFGWAIDVGQATNPNVARFPAAAVLGLTGEALFTGETNRAMSKGGTVEQLRILAQQLLESSQTFQEAFTDETSLKRAMLNYLRKILGLTIADLDLELVKGAKEKGNKTEEANFSALVALLDAGVGGADALPQAEAEQQAEEAESLFELPTKEGERAKERARRAQAHRKEAARLKAAAKVKKTDAEKAADAAAQLTARKSDVATKAARFLVQLWRIFESSFSDKAHTTRKPSKAIGSAGTIAGHGFINLEARLIAALAGSDGGNLLWLGNAEGTKDFMHFELRIPDRPSLSAPAKPAPKGTAPVAGPTPHPIPPEIEVAEASPPTETPTESS